MTKKYAYFFTRQDIFPEYQLVQTAHVALKLGVKASNYVKVDKRPVKPYQHFDFNPSETYFTCIGVRDLTALDAVMDILNKYELEFELFSEPDLNNGEITSVGVYPVDESARGFLLAFDLLKFGSKG